MLWGGSRYLSRLRVRIENGNDVQFHSVKYVLYRVLRCGYVLLER